ncbi:MAG: DUF4416 family protein [Deltaproteobacteria bacterium]|nr:DUF4416 family protein [Deltaproteobacteria bacterium]
MSRRGSPPPARLVVSVIYREEERFRKALAAISDRFGQVAETSGIFPFDRTEYYAKEMGVPLYRRFVVMERLVPRDSLAWAKLAAEEMEAAFSDGGKRTVNVDPGLLTEENYSLATGKNYSHRVYLRDGVFADLTLIYERGGYRPLPWSYPDLASESIRSYLGEVRGRLREARKLAAEEPTCRG